MLALAGGNLSRPTALALAATSLAASLAYLFWPEVATGFRLFSGDHYDGYIALAIHEHWWHVLRGLAPITKVAWFHPWPNTLAYNDGYLLHGLFYAPLRALGASPFLAAELTQMVQKAIGFAALLLIGRRVLGLPWAPAIFAATLATTLPALVQELHHAQFAALGPAFLAAWMGMEGASALLRGRAGAFLAWAAGAAALYGLVLLTAFYVAWGIGLVALVSILLLVLAAPRATRTALAAGARSAAPVALAATFLLLSVLPGLLLYLPIVQQTGLHPREITQAHAGGPGSLIALGEGSFLWSWTQGWAMGRGGALLLNGFGPAFLLLSVAAIPLAWLHARRGDTTARLVFAMGGAALLLSLMTVNWGSVWPWLAIWKGVPGAGAFRVPSRIMFIGGAALALLLGWMLWQVSRRSRAAALGLAALLLVDGWRDHHHLIDTAVEEARLDRLARMPPGCTVFAATRPREGVPTSEIASLYSHNVDAMFIAALVNRPTLNGYSTFFPPGWDLNHPERPDYAERVLREADRHDLRAGLCALDLQDMRWSGPGWSPPQAIPGEPPLLRPGEALRPGAGLPGASMLGRGWADPEPWGSWTLTDSAILWLRLPEGWTGPGVLELSGAGYARDPAGQLVRLTAAPIPERGHWTEARFTAAPQTLRVPFSSADIAEGILRITLQITEPTSPSSLRHSADTRRLGLALHGLALLP